MYAAYGSKRGLFERASLLYLADVVHPMLEPMEQPGAKPATIAGFFTTLATALRNPETRFARRGCFVLNTVLELDQLDAAAVDMVTTYRDRVHAAIENALIAHDDDDNRRSERAEVLTSLHVGVMITARIDPDAAATACEVAATEYR
jgi:hypothetical protein